MPILDLSTDELLSTTHTMCRRLDLIRPVETGVIQQCLEQRGDQQ
ncbi:hypothetical protein [Ktedonobacter sp. SOSP1-52]|nr:hypothetical protein [Ktedonobacter sp. SOSP1-52]